MIDGWTTRRNVLEDVNDVPACVLHPRVVFGLPLRRRGRHQLQQLLVLLVAAVLGQLLDDVRARQRRNLQVVRQRRFVRRGTWERMFLAAVRVRVDQREDGVQIRVAQLAQPLDEIGIVDRVHRQVVASLVAHLRPFQVELNVHARPVAGFVQLAVDFHGRQVRIFGIVRRPLVGD